jgi:glucosylceramidase
MSCQNLPIQLRILLDEAFERLCQPGAKRLDAMSWSGCENLLAFANPDDSVVVVMQNDLCEDWPVRLKIGEKVLAAILQADSFNTFVVRS